MPEFKIKFRPETVVEPVMYVTAETAQEAITLMANQMVGHKPIEVCDVPILGRCVSCGEWITNRDWAVKTTNNSMYCGTCFVPDAGEILRQYGSVREGACNVP